MSHALPMPFESQSAWSEFIARGQLSAQSRTPSESVSGPAGMTSIVCRHVERFPQASVADHVRKMVRAAGSFPGVTVSVNETRAAEHVSDAAAVPVALGSVESVHGTMRS